MMVFRAQSIAYVYPKLVFELHVDAGSSIKTKGLLNVIVSKAIKILVLLNVNVWMQFRS